MKDLLVMISMGYKIVHLSFHSLAHPLQYHINVRQDGL